MNFLEFPYEIQELIYNKLNFIDKCTFDRVAKFKYITRESLSVRMKLVILYKLITSKKLTKLSFKQLKILSMYNRISPGDPSIKEIATTFPEVYEKPRETLYDKIKSGNITDEDLQNITQNDISNSSFRLLGLIGNQNVDMFKRLYQNEFINKFINEYSSTICLSTIYGCNEELFLYLKKNILLENNDKDKMTMDLITPHKTRAFLLKHFTYTREEIETIKKQCLDNLYMDAYLDFAKL